MTIGGLAFLVSLANRESDLSIQSLICVTRSKIRNPCSFDSLCDVIRQQSGDVAVVKFEYWRVVIDVNYIDSNL